MKLTPDEWKRLASQTNVYPQSVQSTGAVASSDCAGNGPIAQPKLYCPAHGKNDLSFNIGGKAFCSKCLAQTLDRIGVHQLVEKPPSVKKGW